MDSPASSSSSPQGPTTSAAFDRLHERVRRWVYQQGWTQLRDVQEKAIPPILEGKQDVILSAATAAGKTEAAFATPEAVEKWDLLLSEDLLNFNYASRYIDTVGAHEALVEILGRSTAAPG